MLSLFLLLFSELFVVSVAWVVLSCMNDVVAIWSDGCVRMSENTKQWQPLLFITICKSRVIVR